MADSTKRCVRVRAALVGLRISSSSSVARGGGRPVASTVMTQTPDERDIETRAELLPEEQAAGSDSPRVQAEAILEESLERTEDPEGTRHSSTQTPG